MSRWNQGHPRSSRQVCLRLMKNTRLSQCRRRTTKLWAPDHRTSLRLPTLVLEMRVETSKVAVLNHWYTTSFSQIQPLWYLPESHPSAAVSTLLFSRSMSNVINILAQVLCFPAALSRFRQSPAWWTGVPRCLVFQILRPHTRGDGSSTA